jgi:hypothetical protein
MNFINNMLVSYFENLRNTTPTSVVQITEIFHDIKHGRWEREILACHQNLELKKELPSFTPTGIYSMRNTKGLLHYSKVICLDIDHVDDVLNLQEKCKTIPWVWASFVTPSGKGLKVFVLTDSDEESFKIYDAEIAVAFYEETGYIRDERCKDISRLQFISFDPGLYVNENPTQFKLKGVTERC